MFRENVSRIYNLCPSRCSHVHPWEVVRSVVPPPALARQCHTLVNEILDSRIYLHPVLGSSEARWCLAWARASWLSAGAEISCSDAFRTLLRLSILKAAFVRLAQEMKLPYGHGVLPLLFILVIGNQLAERHKRIWKAMQQNACVCSCS